MYYRIRTYLAAIVASALLALPASCSKEGPAAVDDAFRPIVLDALVATSPAESGTKAITNPTDEDKSLLKAYSIFTSAYYTDPEFPTTSGNYFTGVKFCYDATKQGWLPAPPDSESDAPKIFWPLAGEGNGLDFLAVATDTTKLDLRPKMVWAGQDDNFLHGERNVHGVKMYVPVSDNDTEVLYAIATKKCSDKTPVQMTFQHTQCCLEFHISLQTNLDKLLRLDNIVVEDAYTSGECRIETHPSVSVNWNFEGTEAFSTVVPGIAAGTPVVMPTTAEPTPIYNMVLPPQPRRDIVFNFRQLSSNDGADDWESLSIRPTYTTSTDAAKWEAGKKYVFEVIIKLEEIIIVPSVADWNEGPDIVVPV